MRLWQVLAAFAISLWAVASPAAADPTTLIADRIFFGANGEVIAEGNVEILQGDRRVKADRLVYDQNTDTVTFDGDVIVTDVNSGLVMTGDAAELDPAFRNGVIEGARIVLDGQLQIAAAELNRVDDRYTQIYKAVASSCRICKNGPPIWQIRAKSVVHDEERKRLYFDQARFEVFGVPVAYFPRLRMPGPNETRATGFLFPEIRRSSNLGTGLKLPYFIVLSPHSDLRITPYLSGDTRTLEFDYRRLFASGSLTVEGAISKDELTNEDTRSYLFADGRFNLPLDFQLEMDIRLVTDIGYLGTYEYGGGDRLINRLEIKRTRRNEHISTSLEEVRTLRASEVPIEDTLPTNLGRFTYERRLYPPVVGGEARFTFDLEGHERVADAINAAQISACNTASVTAPECTARDVVRAGAVGAWRRGWTSSFGLQSAVEGSVAVDTYWINQDNSFDSVLTHATPTVAAELRWPFMRTTRSGARQIIEPIMQVAWTDTLGANVPNEDSRIVEFDEGNLLSLSRFPGSDVYERGFRTTLGANFAHLPSSGLQLTGTVGRVIRWDDLGQFTPSSGLQGMTSDWLLASQVKTNLFTVTNRAIFDDSFSFTKSETQIALGYRGFNASASHIWVIDDPAQGSIGATNEFKFNASAQIGRHVTARVSGRYDGDTGEATDANFGFLYVNECINIDFSVARQFLTSTNLTPSSEYGLSISLNGFGRDGRAFTRNCHTSG